MVPLVEVKALFVKEDVLGLSGVILVIENSDFEERVVAEVTFEGSVAPGPGSGEESRGPVQVSAGSGVEYSGFLERHPSAKNRENCSNQMPARVRLGAGCPCGKGRVTTLKF